MKRAHVLYGTDFPYLRRDLAIKSKQQILQSSALNDVERRAILGGNASSLFPRLQQTHEGHRSDWHTRGASSARDAGRTDVG
jgi:hypothetical protein